MGDCCMCTCMYIASRFTCQTCLTGPAAAERMSCLLLLEEDHQMMTQTPGEGGGARACVYVCKRERGFLSVLFVLVVCFVLVYWCKFLLRPITCMQGH